jgi:hypothetical protein
MDLACHRCGATIASPELFCPHCGAPQLRFEPSEEQLPYQANGNNSGTHVNQPVAWRPAVHAALVMALPVGLLIIPFYYLAILWVLAGGFCAVALYQRKAAGQVNPGAGWRIGLLVGVLAAFLFSIANGLGILFQRYGLNQGALIDQELSSLTQQMTDQLVHQNPEAAQQMPWFIHFWLSADGHAAAMLFGCAFASLAIVALSSIGGILGARILSARKHVSLHS